MKISGESEFNGEKQSVSSNIKFDVFKNANQAIVVAVKLANAEASSNGFNVTSEISLKSQGLGLNYALTKISGVNYARRAITYLHEFRGPSSNERFGVYFNADLKKAVASTVVFNEDVLRAVAQIDPNTHQLSLQSAAKLLDSDSINVDIAVSLRSASAHIKQGNFISIEAEAAIGEALSLKAHGNQKELLSVNVALNQSHLLSTTHNLNDKGLKEFLVCYFQVLRHRLKCIYPILTRKKFFLHRKILELNLLKIVNGPVMVSKRVLIKQNNH